MAIRQAVKLEQAKVTMLYGRLDAARDKASQALKTAYAAGSEMTIARERVEREAMAADQARRLAQLHAVENGLVFGRIDLGEGESTYVGRIGLRDDDHESVLIDWRAPAARPFYVATPSDPGGVVRRRHIHTRERTVVGLDDEVFDLEAMTDGDRRTLVGEAALLAALRKGRTGRMSDVVATIQSEQDRVIRAGLAGALVVQGGPGTGKTVAALHRAAYLLYTHRDTLERRGVLVVGPNPMFLRYIGQVLPSLGETQVVLATVGELFPGVKAVARDEPEVSVVKGDLLMAGLVEAAVADRQRLPQGDHLEVELDGEVLRVPREVVARIRERARAVRLAHNMARKLFVTELLRELAADRARQFDDATALTNFMSEAQAAAFERELAEELAPADDDAEQRERDLAADARDLWELAPVRRALDALWPELTPEQLIGELLSDAEALERLSPEGLRWWHVLRVPEAGGADGWPQDRAFTGSAAGRGREGWGRDDWAAFPWTVDDVPLLDEAAELLGQDDSARRRTERREQAERAERELFAREVMQVSGVADLGYEEMSAGMLADRNDGGGAMLSTAARAMADRTWAYGHVIVDEAQELSPMAWRTLMRRVPAKSLTVVGDIAQTGSAAGASAWGQMLDPYLEGRWREERLLVNYRTPVEIMDVARDVLHLVDPALEPPESVRSGGDAPRAVRCGLEQLPQLVAEEAAAIGEGQVGVVVSDGAYEAVAELFPQAREVEGPVVVLTVTESKGLEFDAVVVVDPEGILAQPQGARDLYVAVTRATRRLAVAHGGALPAVLGNLQSKEDRLVDQSAL